MKLKNIVSFSFGQTSGRMVRMLMDSHPKTFDRDFLVVYENTGREHNKTLEFGEAVSKEWGVRIILLEYNLVEARTINEDQLRPGPARTALKKKQDSNERINWFTNIENFAKLSRIGDTVVPFDKLLDKMPVLPNVVARACSKHLKTEVMIHWAWSIGLFEFNNQTGIRYDEAHRAIEIESRSPSYRHNFFPLIKAMTTKKDVDDWWERQPFRLNIPNHLGNCDGCFLKKRWKLSALAKSSPGQFKWWTDWEDRRRNKGQGGRWIGSLSYHKIADDARSQKLLPLEDVGEDIPCSCAVADANCAEDL